MLCLLDERQFRGRDNAAIYESIVTRDWKFPSKDARYGDVLNSVNVPEQFRVKCLCALTATKLVT